MNQFPLLSAYGLQELLTIEDDPQLWETALSNHWLPLSDPAFQLSPLRFNIGKRLPEGEQPINEEERDTFFKRGMVDVDEWSFEQVDENHLKVVSPPPMLVAAPVLSLGMNMAEMFSGFPKTSTPIPVPQIFMNLGISRPSCGVDQAVVYSSTVMPGASDGKAVVWQRQPDGTWQPTDQCITRWLS